MIEPKTQGKVIFTFKLFFMPSMPYLGRGKDLAIGMPCGVYTNDIILLF